MQRNITLSTALAIGALVLTGCHTDARATAPPRVDSVFAAEQAPEQPSLARGRRIFRFDTFGDETFWTDTVRMHEVIRTRVSPATALAVGLKVDLAALPASLRAALKAGQVNLNDPAVTVALLKFGAVLGVIGEVDASNTLKRVGISCALCHSTVDNSFAPGIGERLDGWPNRDLNVGAIVALSPAVTLAQKAVYQSWGPGMYDPRFSLDGKNVPVVIPAAFGLRNVTREI